MASSVARVAKVAFLVLVMSAFVTPGASGQGSMQDVVYLEDGSVIRGTIIEQIPGESLPFARVMEVSSFTAWSK